MADRTPDPRVLVIADNASVRFGGEALLPVHYTRVLAARGVDVHLLTHARTSAELREHFPDRHHALHHVDDHASQRLLWHIGRRLPGPVAENSTQLAINLISQVRMRTAARRLVARHGIDVVHAPTPVSPRLPSMLWGLGAPVVFGPMNGGMDYPPGFIGRDARARRAIVAVLRAAARGLNALLPGKRRAAALLVANDRTAAALATVVQGPPVHHIVENGVDLEHFVERPARPVDRDRALRLAFVGRLVGWKGVDLLVEALAPIDTATVHLTIFGDGPERPGLEALVARLGLGPVVDFTGFVAQRDLPGHLAEVDVLVLPSLYECGGAVVLEAMAVGLPIVALRWGGPADYLDEGCAVLVDPINREWVVRELTTAITTLRDDPGRRTAMGRRGRAKVVDRYDWERKVDVVMEIYRSVTA